MNETSYLAGDVGNVKVLVVWLNSIIEIVYYLFIASPPTGTFTVYTPTEYVHGASRPAPKTVEVEYVGWITQVRELGVFWGINAVKTGSTMLKFSTEDIV